MSVEACTDFWIVNHRPKFKPQKTRVAWLQISIHIQFNTKDHLTNNYLLIRTRTRAHLTMTPGRGSLWGIHRYCIYFQCPLAPELQSLATRSKVPSRTAANSWRSLPLSVNIWRKEEKIFEKISFNVEIVRFFLYSVYFLFKISIFQSKNSCFIQKNWFFVWKIQFLFQKFYFPIEIIVFRTKELFFNKKIRFLMKNFL